LLNILELSQESKWEQDEFSDKLANYKELWTEVLPDTSIFSDSDLSSLLFTIY
jgi:hypothetical protein